MSISYIRRFYGVPAKRGGRVAYSGRGERIEGTIISTYGSNLRVRLDGGNGMVILHPTWMIEYLPKLQPAAGVGVVPGVGEGE